MGYKGSFLILDAPLSIPPREALRTLGFHSVRPSREQFSIDGASREFVVGLAEFEGRTILSGSEIAEFAWGGQESALRVLMDRLGARRAAALYFESVTDSHAYVIVERDGTSVSHMGSRVMEEGEEEYREYPLAESELRSMWAVLHPWEVEHLGTDEPERDALGRPTTMDPEYGVLENWAWVADFTMELTRRMLGECWDEDNRWSALPARCFEASLDEEPAPREAPVRTARWMREEDQCGRIWWIITLLVAGILTLRHCTGS